MRRAALVAVVLLAGACRQGAGRTCEVNADCDDGLVCVLPVGQLLASGRVCQPTATPDAGSDGSTDAASMSDMTVAPEAAAGDAAVPDMVHVAD